MSNGPPAPSMVETSMSRAGRQQTIPWVYRDVRSILESGRRGISS
jgi:hypothetical protein